MMFQSSLRLRHAKAPKLGSLNPKYISILNCSKTRLSWEMARLWAEESIASHRAGAAVGIEWR
jgi:hypothetical protein